MRACDTEIHLAEHLESMHFTLCKLRHNLKNKEKRKRKNTKEGREKGRGFAYQQFCQIIFGKSLKLFKTALSPIKGNTSPNKLKVKNLLLKSELKSVLTKQP